MCNSQIEIQIYLNNDLTKILNHITLYDISASSKVDFIRCFNFVSLDEFGDKIKDGISSISCKVSETDYSVEFSSKTESRFESKKYNRKIRKVEKIKLQI